ncbi:MAG TPA: sortase [Solirubrobacteraceae bacterium]|nr:sortase [Solirubrobacteraceae bacterium]
MKLAPPRPLDGPTAGPGSKSSAATLLPRTAVRPGGLAGGHPRAVRRLLKALAILLGVLGVLALVDGVLTLVWQEPVSGLLAHISQGELAKSLNTLEHQRPTLADEKALDGLPTDQQRMAFFASSLEQTAQPGQAIGRIVIPRIGADFVVVAGTSAASLEKGPGLYSGTSVPGLSGTVGIAGHRTTYLAPFRRINELGKGDLITLQMPYGIFTYTVTGQKIVAPNDISVLRPTGYDQVVLTACNPLYSASQRLAVFARLTSSVPTGLALSTSVPPTPAVAAPTPNLDVSQFSSALLGAVLQTGLGPFASVDTPAAGSQSDGILVGPTTLSMRRPVRKAAAPHHPQTTSTPPPAATQTPSRSTAPAVPTAPPVTAAPRQPVRVLPTVRPRTPARSTGSAGASPTKQSSGTHTSSPVTSSPVTPTASQEQTRVQGAPGGPAPIIGTSG